MISKDKLSFPAWAEIDLTALLKNIREVKDIIGNSVGICLVVKADAYGYGVEEIVNECKNEKYVDMFGVATFAEGKKLRRMNVQKPILVFRDPFTWELEQAVSNDLIVTLSTFETIEAVRKSRKRFRAHIKIDTGLGRIGFLPEHLEKISVLLHTCSNLNIEGIYSHFADSYSINPENAYKQLQIFLQSVAYLENAGFQIPIKHIASSNAALFYPESRLDMVRIGGAIYNRLDDRFLPVFSLHSRVGLIKKIKKGTQVGYGLEYRANKDELIATILIGHADGVSPCLGGEVGEVLIGGKRYPIIGRICMDQLMVAIRDSIQSISRGEEVVIVGRQGKEEITLRDIFSNIGYWNVIATGMNRRLPRVYIRDGKVVKIVERLTT